MVKLTNEWDVYPKNKEIKKELYDTTKELMFIVEDEMTVPFHHKGRRDLTAEAIEVLPFQ